MSLKTTQSDNLGGLNFKVNSRATEAMLYVDSMCVVHRPHNDKQNDSLISFKLNLKVTGKGIISKPKHCENFV